LFVKKIKTLKSQKC